MKYRILTFLAIACMVAPAAKADAHVGAGFGQSSVDAAGLDGDDTVWKLYGGYKFMKYFDVEGAYSDAGLHLAPTTVGRMLREEAPFPEPVPVAATGSSASKRAGRGPIGHRPRTASDRRVRDTTKAPVECRTREVSAAGRAISRGRSTDLIPTAHLLSYFAGGT